MLSDVGRRPDVGYTAMGESSSMSESKEVRSEESVSASDSREVRVDAGEREMQRTCVGELEGVGDTSFSSDKDGSEGGTDCAVSRPFGAVSRALYQADSSRLSRETVLALISGFSSHR